MTDTPDAAAAPDAAAPSERARALVRGAYDTHIHVGPDVMKRRILDVDLARRFADVGLAGFVLKSHYVPTAERAQVVRAVVPEVRALGAITLNGSVGGLNPSAVEIAFTVPVKPGDDPSTRLPPVPIKSAVKAAPPPSESVPPFDSWRKPALMASENRTESVPSSRIVALGSLTVSDFTTAVAPGRSVMV